jgi:hypothetical protein
MVMAAAVSHSMPSGSLISGAAAISTFGAVGAQGVDEAGVGHLVADRDVAHPRADGFDHAGSLDAHAGRQRDRVGAVAKIGVGKVQADRDMPQADFALPRIADNDVLELEDFRAAGLVETDCLFQGALLMMV